MSEAAERENTTEQPTEKKIQDSIERGEFPISREVNALCFLLAAYGVIILVVQPAGSGLIEALSHVLSLDDIPAMENGRGVAHLVARLAVHFAWCGLLILSALIVAGVLAHLVQSQVRASPNHIKPQLSRVSPTTGFTRLFGMVNLLEFAKSLIKLTVVTAVCYGIVLQELPRIQQAVQVDPQQIPQSLLVLTANLLLWTAASICLFVAGDVFIARMKWQRNLRMTRQEVQQEHKEAEGDPFIRARRLTIARSRQRNRMMAAVPTATVVVANPTHYAVALRYVRTEEAAPRVVAKGQDFIALRIRAIAQEAGVPVVEDKALARALYRQVELDQLIPREFYRAVADIIAYIQKHRQRR